MGERRTSVQSIKGRFEACQTRAIGTQTIASELPAGDALQDERRASVKSMKDMYEQRSPTSKGSTREAGGEAEAISPCRSPSRSSVKSMKDAYEQMPPTSRGRHSSGQMDAKRKEE